MIVTTAWPPPYLIKQHPRARSVKLRIAKHQGLIITVPPRFSLNEIPDLLEKHKQWINTQIARHQVNGALPEQIDLRAIQAMYAVKYIECATKMAIVPRPHHEIVVVGKIQEQALCKKILIKWLKELAKKHLIDLLDTVSKTTKLCFNEVRIRDQSSLWGSCTVKKTISLNYKLIFLSPAVVNYVLVHELCHTVHLNHSARFWHLVEKHDPNWREHRAALRRADDYVPGWV